MSDLSRPLGNLVHLFPTQTATSASGGSVSGDPFKKPDPSSEDIKAVFQSAHGMPAGDDVARVAKVRRLTELAGRLNYRIFGEELDATEKADPHLALEAYLALEESEKIIQSLETEEARDRIRAERKLMDGWIEFALPTDLDALLRQALDGAYGMDEGDDARRSDKALRLTEIAGIYRAKDEALAAYPVFDEALKVLRGVDDDATKAGIVVSQERILQARGVELSDLKSLFKVSGGIEALGSMHVRDESNNLPLSFLAFLKGDYQFWLVDEVAKAGVHVKVMGGTANQDNGAGAPKTILGGPLEKGLVYRNRFDPNLGGPNFGIPVLNADVTFVDALLKAWVGIGPQEDFLYPYLSFLSSRYNLFDNTSGANLYTALIGFLAGAEWDLGSLSEILSGLKVSAQAAMDGGFSGSSSWALTGQASWTSPGYDVAGIPMATSVALYYTTVNPAEPVNEFGETVSDKSGFGGGVIQTVGDFQFSAGYAQNGQSLRGDGVSVDTGIEGLNLTASRKFLDGDCLLGAGYSFLGLNEKTEAFTSGEEKTSESAVEIHGSCNLGMGLTAYANANWVLVDQKNQTNPDVHGNEQLFTLGLSYAFEEGW